MENFVLIAVCIIAGMALKAARLIPDDAHKGINTWILYIALPAVSFKYIPNIHWSMEMLFPVLSTIVVWMGSWLFMEFYCKYKKYGQRTRSTLELASGYSNTGFIGFPLIAAYFGEEYLSIAIICDQMVFVLLSTAGLINAIKGNKLGSGQVEVGVILKRLLTFPPLLGCISALLLPRFFDLSFAEPFFGKLAATVGPLALFSIGLQLRFKGWKKEISQLSATIFYKLMIAPFLVLLSALAFSIRGSVVSISIFEAAMPTLISAGIVAGQYNLNFRLINLVIGIGILLSFVTTAIWYHALQWLGI